MKLSNLTYAAIGYTLGAKAGRDRYEDIVRIARRVAGSQTVQATAGVLEGRFDQYIKQVRSVIDSRLANPPSTQRANGHQR
ncbi:hypothetical protein [uncultured Jatrophihabitans sp.]|uniref:hypothetical protein n=1 Tax=uncultured Jatrophihabitans sp. TaxID=1610747 RepID=UPI0035CBD6F2